MKARFDEPPPPSKRRQGMKAMRAPNMIHS